MGSRGSKRDEYKNGTFLDAPARGFEWIANVSDDRLMQYNKMLHYSPDLRLKNGDFRQRPESTADTFRTEIQREIDFREFERIRSKVVPPGKGD